MASYVIKIQYIDSDEPVIVDLAGMDRETAEDVTANLHYDLAEARSINAPVVEVRADVPGSNVVLEPGRIRTIDLVEIDDPSTESSADETTVRPA